MSNAQHAAEPAPDPRAIWFGAPCGPSTRRSVAVAGDMASDVAKFAATTPERASCWETDAPVFILGADGQTHETRPTTSLAQDLDKLEADAPSPSRARRREADERPIAPAEARPTERRLSFADRPLSGFGGSSPSFQQRRSIGGYENTAPAPCSRRSSTGSVKSPAERSERSERSVRQSRSEGAQSRIQ
ncbi:unnamed protein product [Effrenium voratum]|nr:unnamed protein product [Effrenium voratum]